MDNLDVTIKKVKIVLKVGDKISILDKLKIKCNEKVKYNIIDPKIISVDNNYIVTALEKGRTYIEMFFMNNKTPNYIIKINVLNNAIETDIDDKNLSVVNIFSNKYTYDILKNDINELCCIYNDILNYEILGKSYDNRNIYLFTLGNKNAKHTLFIQASMHGREHMASILVMRHIELLCKNYYISEYKGLNISDILQNIKICIVPMSNPDGVDISINGAEVIREKTLFNNISKVIEENKIHHEIWKSNARCVDLNRNFGCKWEDSYNFNVKSFMEYRGEYPESEIESRLIANWTRENRPDICISYHATGSELYWDYGQKGLLLNKSMVIRDYLKDLTFYKLMDRSSAYKTGVLGYSDWVSMYLGIPAFTIEIGSPFVTAPLSMEEFNDIWEENKFIPIELCRYVVNKKN